MAKSINQGPAVGAFEGRVLQQGGFNTPLGNQVARNIGKGGPGAGRTLYGKSGQQATYGSNPGNPPERPRSGDVMSRSGR